MGVFPLILGQNNEPSNISHKDIASIRSMIQNGREIDEANMIRMAKLLIVILSMYFGLLVFYTVPALLQK
jgi:hypothetical protein